MPTRITIPDITRNARVAALPRDANDVPSAIPVSDPDAKTAFAWDEPTFLHRTEGGPIRRIGHLRWLRNIAVALGNALRGGDASAAQALATRREHPDVLVREHVHWGLAQARLLSKP